MVGGDEESLTKRAKAWSWPRGGAGEGCQARGEAMADGSGTEDGLNVEGERRLSLRRGRRRDESSRGADDAGEGHWRRADQVGWSRVGRWSWRGWGKWKTRWRG